MKYLVLAALITACVFADSPQPVAVNSQPVAAENRDGAAHGHGHGHGHGHDHGHDHGSSSVHSAPVQVASSGYSAPSNSYSQPAPVAPASYQAPQASGGYDAPAPAQGAGGSYGAEQPQQPQQTYGTQGSTGYYYYYYPVQEQSSGAGGYAAAPAAPAPVGGSSLGGYGGQQQGHGVADHGAAPSSYAIPDVGGHDHGQGAVAGGYGQTSVGGGGGGYGSSSSGGGGGYGHGGGKQKKKGGKGGKKGGKKGGGIFDNIGKGFKKMQKSMKKMFDSGHDDSSSSGSGYDSGSSVTSYWPLDRIGGNMFDVVIGSVVLAGLGGVLTTLFGTPGIAAGRSLDGARASAERAFHTAKSAFMARVPNKEEMDQLSEVVHAALENQECMQRIWCETGAILRKYDQAEKVLTLVEKYGPKMVGKPAKILKKSMSHNDCNVYQCGKLSYKK